MFGTNKGDGKVFYCKGRLGRIHNLPRGGAMMVLRGDTLFPYYDLGGAVENFQQK